MARARRQTTRHTWNTYGIAAEDRLPTQELPPAKEVAEIRAGAGAGSDNGQLISILDGCVRVCACVCVCDDCNRNANRFRNVLRPSVRGDVTTLPPTTWATVRALIFARLILLALFGCLPFWRVSITFAVSSGSLLALLRHVCNPLCSLLKVKWCAPKLSNFPSGSEWVFFAVFPL